MSSAEEQSSCFLKLNDGNYIEWSIQMEAELIKRGLWTMVEIIVDVDGKDADSVHTEWETKKSKRNSQKMAETQSKLILCVEDNQLTHMCSKDPMVIWETLRGVHCARGFATSLALRRKFLTARKDINQSMQAWIGSIRTQAFIMEESGITVSEHDMILALTMGLPDSYNPVIINFDATPTDQLNFEHVVTRLLNEETQQNSVQSTDSKLNGAYSTNTHRIA